MILFKVLASLPFIGAAFCIGCSLRAIARGEIKAGKSRASITYRTAQPFSYWFSVLLSFAMAGILILAGLAFLGHAPLWFIHWIREIHPTR